MYVNKLTARDKMYVGFLITLIWYHKYKKFHQRYKCIDFSKVTVSDLLLLQLLLLLLLFQVGTK